MSTDNQDIVAAILTLACLQGDPKTPQEVALEFKSVREELKKQERADLKPARFANLPHMER